MSKAKQYPIFEKWIKILDWILDRTEKFPRSLRFSLASRLANTALDILDYILEAIYTKDRKSILKKINLYMEKQRVLLRICFQRKVISGKQFEFIVEQILECGRMIGGWIRHEALR